MELGRILDELFFINIHLLYLVQRGWDFRTQMPMDGNVNGTPERPVGRDVGFRGGAEPGICRTACDGGSYDSSAGEKDEKVSAESIRRPGNTIHSTLGGGDRFKSM